MATTASWDTESEKYMHLAAMRVYHNKQNTEIDKKIEAARVTAPVRGIDYWTEADKDEIKSYVDEVILGGAW